MLTLIGKNNMIKIFTRCLILTILCSSCLFSGNDITTYPVVGNYYINSLGDIYQICYREKNDETEKIIVAENIDSIGWNSELIVVTSDTTHFVIDQSSTKVRRYSDYDKYRNSAKSNVELTSIATFIQTRQ